MVPSAWTLSLLSAKNSAGSRGETGPAVLLRSLQPEKVRPFLYHLIGDLQACVRDTIQLAAAYRGDKVDEITLNAFVGRKRVCAEGSCITCVAVFHFAFWQRVSFASCLSFFIVRTRRTTEKQI